MVILFRIIVFVSGLLLIVGTLASAIQTFVLPRGSTDFITGAVFRFIRWCFDLFLHRSKNYVTRDRFMALYAPISVLVLLPVWLILISIGYAAMFWATGIDSLLEAYTISGSSLLTLGFAKGETLVQTLIAFSEATIGGDFEMALERFADQGIPIKENKDHTWQDFAGWRVNYDSVLVELNELTMATTAIWF